MVGIAVTLYLANYLITHLIETEYLMR